MRQQEAKNQKKIFAGSTTGKNDQRYKSTQQVHTVWEGEKGRQTDVETQIKNWFIALFTELDLFKKIIQCRQ